MKTTIIALSAAAFIAAAPAVLAQGVSSKTTPLQHKVSKKHRPGITRYAPLRQVQAKGSKNSYPGALGYAPDEPIDRDIAASRQAGGGGGM